MTNFVKKSLLCTFVLILLLALLPTTNVYASSTMPPHGYTWKDSSTNKLVYQYNTYNSSKGYYTTSKTVYSDGKNIYNSKNELIFANTNGSVGYDEKGTLLVVSANGTLYGSSNLKVFQALLEGKNATYFKYSVDNIVTSVKTSDGMVSVSSFKLTQEALPGSNSETETVINKAKNRVDQTENSAGEMVFKAYKNGKAYMTIIVDGPRVLNNTAKVRLSDTLIGAKFLGIDSSYNVYMYENNGSLYRFKHGSWHSAQKIALKGNFKSCEKDKNGFVTKISLANKTYTIKQLTTDSKWKANRTYAVNKDSYSTMYIKNSSKSNTLSLKDKVLQLNGKTVAKNVGKFYFVNNKRFVYTKGTTLYEASINKPKATEKVTSKFKKVTLKNGLAVKAVLKNGKTIKLS